MTMFWYLLPAVVCPLGTATMLALVLKPQHRHDSTAESAARLREAAAFRAHLSANRGGSDAGLAVGTNR